MPRIKEYLSDAKLVENDTGFSALETAGRRVGPLINAAASDVREQGKLVADYYNQYSEAFTELLNKGGGGIKVKDTGSKGGRGGPGGRIDNSDANLAGQAVPFSGPTSGANSAAQTRAEISRGAAALTGAVAGGIPMVENDDGVSIIGAGHQEGRGIATPPWPYVKPFGPGQAAFGGPDSLHQSGSPFGTNSTGEPATFAPIAINPTLDPVTHQPLKPVKNQIDPATGKPYTADQVGPALQSTDGDFARLDQPGGPATIPSFTPDPSAPGEPRFGYPPGPPADAPFTAPTTAPDSTGGTIWGGIQNLLGGVFGGSTPDQPAAPDQASPDDAAPSENPME